MRRTPQSRLAKIIGVVLVAGFLTSCSSTSTTTNRPNPGNGNLDHHCARRAALQCDFRQCRRPELEFYSGRGRNPRGYITTTPPFAPEIRLNLQQLRDFSTILYEYPVRAGSYNQANLNFELAQLAAYDPTLNPPVHILHRDFHELQAHHYHQSPPGHHRRASQCHGSGF